MSPLSARRERKERSRERRGRDLHSGLEAESEGARKASPSLPPGGRGNAEVSGEPAALLRESQVGLHRTALDLTHGPLETAAVAKSTTSRVLRVGARLSVIAIAVGLFAWTIASTNLKQVGGLIGHVGPWVLLALIPAVVLMGCESWAWSRLYRLVDRSPSFPRLVGVRVASEAVSLSVPGGSVAAEALKVILGRTRLRMPEATTSATLAARAPLALASLSVYLVVGVVTNALVRRDFALFGNSGLAIALFGVAVLLFLVAGATSFALRGALAARLHRLLMRLPIRRFRGWLDARKVAFDSADQQVQHIREAPPSSLLAAALPLLVGLFAQAAETWIMLRLLGASLPIGEIVCLDASVGIIRSVAFVLPAGLGLTDVTYVAAFHALGVADAPTLGAAFAILKRGRDLILIAIGYGLLALARRSDTRPKPPHPWQNAAVGAPDLANP